MDIVNTRLVAVPNSIVGALMARRKKLDGRLLARLTALEQYDFGFLLLALSPRRLLNEGRLFDNEQVLPLLIHFAQWDKHCKQYVAELFKQWVVFNPSQGDFEGVDMEKAISFRDYFLTTYAIPLIEEFRKFVAVCMLYPEKSNAPPGPVDMVWHAFLLDTDRYASFSSEIWLIAPHVPPDIRERWLANSAPPFSSPAKG